MTSFSNTANSSRRAYPLKTPLLTRFFNVIHYGTVALLVGSTVFLGVNVVGAAQAKKKSFRAEQAKAMEAIASTEEEVSIMTDNKQTS